MNDINSSFNHAEISMGTLSELDLADDLALTTDGASGLSHVVHSAGLSLMIGLVDDHRLSKECLVRSFEETADSIRVCAFATIEELVSNQHKSFDLVLLSIHVGTMSERAMAESLATIAEEMPNVPVVVMSDAVDEQQYKLVRDVFNSGAQGLISTKSTGITLAIAALRLIKAGGTFAPAHLLLPGEPEPSKSPQEPALRARFTARQVSVLAHMARGSANKIIAHELQMSESTVKVHVRNIMRRVGATNRTQAVYNAQALWRRDGTNRPE